MKMVMVKSGQSVEPRRVEVGITNGIFTEVSGLAVGDTVITGIKSTAGASAAGEMETNPFMPTRPGGGRR